MFVQVVHNIADRGSWAERLEDFEKQGPPTQFTLHSSGTSIDHTKAFCLWEAESVDALSAFLDGATAGAAQNVYYALDETAPGTTLPRTAGAQAAFK